MFDADGTLRWTTTPGAKYPVRAGEWRLMPRVERTLRSIPWGDDGPWLGVCSNQSGVGEGLLTSEAAKALILDTIEAALGETPRQVAIEMCTCAEGLSCGRRKPNAGLLLAVMQRFEVAPSDALYVGDLPIDEQAAHAAGVSFVSAATFFAEPS